jgi:hypothetical protein
VHPSYKQGFYNQMVVSTHIASLCLVFNQMYFWFY